MEKLQQWLINSEDIQIVLFFGLLFILIGIEHLSAYRKVRRGKRWFTNFVLTFLSIITMLFLPVSFITAAKFANDKHFGLINLFHLHWLLLLILTLLLRGFISFFTHYLAHKIPIVWRIHRVHHLDTAVDVSTNVRFHPVEFIFNLLIGIPLILILGLPIWVLMLYELLDVVVTLVSHANISFPPKIEKILRYIIVTPDLHRIHHSSYQPETDSNFGAVFPIWDIVFGTFKTKTKIDPKEMEIGLKEIRDERTNNIIWLLLSPFRNFKKDEKISPPLLYKIFIVLIGISFMLPLKRQFKFPFSLIGFIFLLFGTYMAVSSKKLFIRTNTPMHPFTNPNYLHQKGFFKYSRNPMYLGISIGLFGLGILSGYIFNLSYSLLYIIICDVLYVRAEEKKLKKKFGKKFNEYKQRTRRWI